jgi:hypothetical protein
MTKQLASLKKKTEYLRTWKTLAFVYNPQFNQRDNYVGIGYVTRPNSNQLINHLNEVELAEEL